jgi:hypothetical protein
MTRSDRGAAVLPETSLEGYDRGNIVVRFPANSIPTRFRVESEGAIFMVRCVEVSAGEKRSKCQFN